MLGSVVIVFREVLEAALVVSILMAATRGLTGRNRWIGGGVFAGLAGAFIVALLAGAISQALGGAGQEMLNAAILLTAVAMLAWHNIWMARHARDLIAHLKNIGTHVGEGLLPLYFLSVAAGLAVLREGSEVVLFMYGIAASGNSEFSILGGGLIGLLGGMAVGCLLYLGLLRIRPQHLFKVTGWMILLLAAGLAASAAGYLAQAGVLPSQGPLWDTSDLLSEKSMVGQLLHILIGYQARPRPFQLTFYVVTLLLIAAGMWLASGRERPVQTAE